MALIEHLECDGWEAFLRDMFRYTLDVLENDRFGSVGSSVDDLRSWLARGGSPGFANVSMRRWMRVVSRRRAEQPSTTASSSWCAKLGVRSST